MNELKCKCLTASSGLRCNNKAKAGGYCGKHTKCKTNWNSHQLMKNPVHNSNQCICTNAKMNKQCIHKTLHDSLYCGVHKKCKTTFKPASIRESLSARLKLSPSALPRETPKAASYKDNQINYSPSVFASQINKYVPRQKQVEDIMFNPSLLAKNAREQSPWLMKVKTPKTAHEDVMYSPHLNNLFSPSPHPKLSPSAQLKLSQKTAGHSSDLFVSPLKKRSPRQKQSHMIKNLLRLSPSAPLKRSPSPH